MTLLVMHPACLAHEMGDGHPERPDRLRATTGLTKPSSTAPGCRRRSRSSSERRNQRGTASMKAATRSLLASIFSAGLWGDALQYRADGVAREIGSVGELGLRHRNLDQLFVLRTGRSGVLRASKAQASGDRSRSVGRPDRRAGVPSAGAGDFTAGPGRPDQHPNYELRITVSARRSFFQPTPPSTTRSTYNAI